MAEKDTLTVKLIANIKYQGKRYVKGDTINVLSQHYEDFEKADVIDKNVVFQDESNKDESLDKMTIAELREYAESHKIDLGNLKKKDEILFTLQKIKNEED